MRLYLGLDGGGTKTLAALVDEGGRLVSEIVGGASNPLRSSLARSLTALDDAAARALALAKAEATDVCAVTAGLAGAGQPRLAHRIAAFLSTRFRGATVEATTDLDIALESVAETGPAAVLVAGTGSASFGRDASGRSARAGGWGPWFSDEGSAFDIGRRALLAMARTRDAALSASRLDQAVCECLGYDDWQRLVDDIARKPLERLPALFPAVVAAAEAGGETARAILAEAAASLAQLAGTVIGRLDLGSDDFPVGCVGGVFGRTRFLDDEVGRQLSLLAPRAWLTPPRISPAVAAAQRALRRAGGPF
ncbi:MAG TPA: BadF/BadG/BcrA/BcrD ATPase family protein [Candidatus Dormibacteraeota bacterium]|nr:BadF/BadG/BcrA/BcrD ATPase family protein [Candidatus Dormibacteraeota bacterium]